MYCMVETVLAKLRILLENYLSSSNAECGVRNRIDMAQGCLLIKVNVLIIPINGIML